MEMGDFMKKLLSVAGITGFVAATVVLGPATAANAAPLVCEPGYKSAKWTSVSQGWVITHAKQVSIAADSTGTYSKTATYRKTVTSGREITTGVNYSASWVISSLDANVSGTLTRAGEKTKETSETITFNFNRPGTYAIFSGVKSVTGYYTAKTCNSRGTGWGSVGYGKGHSWSVDAEGAVKCTENPAAGTAKRAAKNGYC
ncbi:hypothetical protein [Streptomyces acidiscabies]|uniref:Uncharacterized protein n=1 Tax=Streptomyces acidiscabies TaxID=42234 RepID=A0AAP6B9P5_9ACTN|nr:hypothetical protein [Streptomyces acidiscabies]MBP5937153.1 hypothetical protein [Streptomyces sp. LBUM 1476]MBZ3914798.1 hypothetical protein [Streptomyces acidiscabies]MDX2960750.1 hypothetical protein [Streptomyces acidiscabies]MDX3020714.1 hypothetical protein [Streptomyces acidiscabies]MDX3792915.1 hypothetical protein [Streptomyces acidiscabies]